MKIKTNSQKSKEAQTVALLMLQNKWKASDVAQRLGCATHYFSNALYLNFPNLLFRYRIEDAFARHIFFSEREFLQRRELTKFCGFNPMAATFPKLQKFAKVKGLGIKGATRKDQIIAAITAALTDQAYAKKN